MTVFDKMTRFFRDQSKVRERYSLKTKQKQENSRFERLETAFNTICMKNTKLTFKIFPDYHYLSVHQLVFSALMSTGRVSNAILSLDSHFCGQNSSFNLVKMFPKVIVQHLCNNTTITTTKRFGNQRVNDRVIKSSNPRTQVFF